MPQSEICFMEAAELVRKIRNKDVSCVEVMEAHLAQIDRVNPKVNAIVTLLPDRALAGGPEFRGGAGGFQCRFGWIAGRSPSCVRS